MRDWVALLAAVLRAAPRKFCLIAPPPPAAARFVLPHNLTYLLPLLSLFLRSDRPPSSASPFSTLCEGMAADSMDGLVSFSQFSSSPPINLVNSPPALLVSAAQLQDHADARPSSSSTAQSHHHRRTQSHPDQSGRRGKKRKLSQPANRGQSRTSPDNGHEDPDDGAANAGSPPRKQRACDQCKQQKV